MFSLIKWTNLPEAMNWGKKNYFYSTPATNEETPSNPNKDIFCTDTALQKQ